MHGADTGEREIELLCGETAAGSEATCECSTKLLTNYAYCNEPHLKVWIQVEYSLLLNAISTCSLIYSQFSILCLSS
jgi:hypothetical protein